MSIVAGVGVGMIAILILRVVIYQYFPFPESLDYDNPQDKEIYIQGLPDKAFVFMVVSHVIGAFAGALITGLVSSKHRFSNGIMTGAVIFVSVMVFNFSQSFPAGYVVIDTLCAAVAAFGGASFGQGRRV